ncbi:hypothetical protein ACS65S_13640 [Staphylococcus saprophyticus]
MFSNDSLVIGINDYHDINIIKKKINKKLKNKKIIIIIKIPFFYKNTKTIKLLKHKITKNQKN